MIHIMDNGLRFTSNQSVVRSTRKEYMKKSALVLCVMLLSTTTSQVVVARGGGRSGGSHSSSHPSSPGYSGHGTGSNPSSHSVGVYTRKNGTYVPPHRQSNPDKSFNNNWSTKPNTNSRGCMRLRRFPSVGWWKIKTSERSYRPHRAHRVWICSRIMAGLTRLGCAGR